ncbi:MAG TPA: hypothetical protein VGR62_22115 [Candidatus Binatia bacterium]|nr:hypothetical protein [Candidatus Binatia bacterium]
MHLGTLLLCALVVLGGNARAGGPPPGERSFGTFGDRSARITFTVTDHGDACGPAGSTASWVLRTEGAVLCSRNDVATTVQYPACDDNNQPAQLCVSSENGVTGLTETELVRTHLPQGSWLAYKFYSSEIASLLGVEGCADGSCLATSRTACKRPETTGLFAECEGDFACDRTCDAGVCEDGVRTCGADIDCSLFPCTPTERYDQNPIASTGSRAEYDVVLGFTKQTGPIIGIGAPIHAGQSCLGAACGDGFLDTDLGELCDDGADNGTTASSCSCNCGMATSAPTETCDNCLDDDGNALVDADDPACCTLAEPITGTATYGRNGLRLSVVARPPPGVLFDAAETTVVISTAEAGCQVIAGPWRRVGRGQFQQSAVGAFTIARATIRKGALRKLVLKTPRTGFGAAMPIHASLRVGPSGACGVVSTE